MMAKPWAKATAAIPLRPAPPPTTAAAPAPMNTNAKVPMNSARSLGAIRLDIVDSRDEIDRSARSGLRQGTIRWLGVADGTGERRRPAKRAGLLRGDRLRLEIDAQRLRDASAVCRIGLGAVGDVPLLDLCGSRRPSPAPCSRTAAAAVPASFSGTGCRAAPNGHRRRGGPNAPHRPRSAAAARRNRAGCPKAPRCWG